MKVLSVSTVYPNEREPGLGTFVQSRLSELARLADLKVIAPIPIIDYSKPLSKWIYRHPPTGRGETALYPRWLYPPGGTPLNVLCLSARLAPPIAALRKAFPFQLIDAHFGYPEGVTAALLSTWFQVPFVVTLRGSEPQFSRSVARRATIAWALRRAAAVLTVSNELARYAKTLGIPEQRIHTIPNGVDTQTFGPRDRKTSRDRFGIDPETKLIVSAGELIEAKGHHLAIRAVADLISRGRRAALLIAGGVARGGRPFDAALRSMITELGVESSVKLLGAVNRSEMAELLSAADVFTLPSYGEGCPNVVCEALACGTPVVGSAVGAVPDIVSSQFGIVVPPRDEKALTSALERAIVVEWDRRAIAKAGRSRTWSTVAQEIMSVFERVIMKRTPQRQPVPSLTGIESSNVRN